MRIAVDIQPLVSISATRGMGRYTSDLLWEMFRQDQKNEYYLFNLYGESTIDGKTLPPNVHYQKFYMGRDNYLLRRDRGEEMFHMHYKKLLEGMFQTFIRENDIDVFFLTSVFDDCISFKKEWFRGTKVAVIAYDLIPLVFSSQYLTDPAVRESYYTGLDCMTNADLLLAISHSAKDDLVKHAGVPEDKIAVINSGVNRVFEDRTFTKEEKDQVYKKYGITEKFMIFPTGQDFRKNNEGTILGYSKLPQKIRDEYQLVITGSVTPEYKQQMLDYSAQNGAAGRVVFTGYIPDADLLVLYNEAVLVVFPSLYEGFGLPVMEAFMCGKNVVTSNNSSLGEVAKDAAVLVDPFHPDDIARGLEEALTKTDFSLFKDEIQRKIELYTWENTAREALKAFEELNGKKTDVQKADGRKKKIAFFTPLSPLQSGISDYSEDIIGELCRYCDIDVFIDDGYEADTQFADNVRVCRHDEFPGKSGGYDEIIYQMGNSEFHLYMIPYIQNYPGIVVIHDLNLHSCIYILYAMRGYWDKYRGYIKYEVDPVERYIKLLQLKPDLWIKAVHEITANRFVADYAKKILVHSEYSRQELLKKNIGYQIRTVPHYAKIEDKADVGALRRRYGIPEDMIMIAAFGQAAEVKRIIPSLKAITPLLREHPNARYYIVGKVLEQEISDFIGNSGLSGQIVVTGFVEDVQTFKDYIAMTDICLNLRYPYFGETSGSFMRILAAGKPAVVTRIGAFDEIPEDCCLKVGFGEDTEVKEIGTAVKKLLDDQTFAAQIGENARHYAEETLNLKKIAREYYDFICAEPECYLNESDIAHIYLNEMLPRGAEDRQEMTNIAGTLSYLINPKAGRIDAAEVETEEKDEACGRQDEELYAELEKRGIRIL